MRGEYKAYEEGKKYVVQQIQQRRAPIFVQPGRGLHGFEDNCKPCGEDWDEDDEENGGGGDLNVTDKGGKGGKKKGDGKGGFSMVIVFVVGSTGIG